MSQIIRGLVDVTNGSNIVTGDASALFSSEVPAVVVNDLFKVNGETTYYTVLSIDSDTQITLTSNYGGSTNTGLSYTITQDFYVNLNMIRVNNGDAELAEILDRNFLLLDTEFGNMLISVIRALIIGGTLTTSDLTFKTTAGVGAAGADMHFLVGNNGSIEAITILNNGNVGIGTDAPDDNVHIRGGSNTVMKMESDSGGTATIALFEEAGGIAAGTLLRNDGDADRFGIWTGATTLVERFTILRDTGRIGIGTVLPGNPLAVNRSDDGVIVDFESADIVEGTISIAGNETSYNAFVGSHYTQLKDGQIELPRGAVMISTGEIIPCSVEKESEVEVPIADAIDIVLKVDAVETVDIEVEDEDNVVSTDTSYEYDIETDKEKAIVKDIYGKKIIEKKRFKAGVQFDNKTRKFYKVKAGYRLDKDKAHQTVSNIELIPGKEYFVYVDTTTIVGDKRVYGTWFGKMSDDAKGMSFGDDNKPVYLVAQVGLFKIRVTDTNGNIRNGDYLETSTRAMEAQKQTAGTKKNSTIAKATIDVDWTAETIDPVLGYKWKLIPATF